MNKALNRLSALQVKNLTDPGMHHDGGGLYLQVSRTGSKSWILRYTLDKKTRELGLGSYRDWNLAQARERALKFRQMVSDKIDPIAEKKERVAEKKERVAELAASRREAARKQVTFAECAHEYHEANKSQWQNAKHAAQWISTLKTCAFPVFGSRPVGEVDRETIRAALLPIWNTKAVNSPGF